MAKAFLPTVSAPLLVGGQTTQTNDCWLPPCSAAATKRPAAEGPMFVHCKRESQAAGATKP